MAKRRRSENRPLCISVQGHPRSNPRYASDRHTWVSYRHLTFVITRTVSEIIGLEVDLFDAPLSLMIEKTGRFWTTTNTFSERWSTLVVIAVKNFSNERKCDGRGEKMTDFSRFFGRCDLVFELFQTISPQYKSRTRWDVRAKFGEKRKKSKSTEKHNITEILKNCIFAKTAI